VHIIWSEILRKEFHIGRDRPPQTYCPGREDAVLAKWIIPEEALDFFFEPASKTMSAPVSLVKGPQMVSCRASFSVA
jgi:hypothetical protein